MKKRLNSFLLVGVLCLSMSIYSAQSAEEIETEMRIHCVADICQAAKNEGRGDVSHFIGTWFDGEMWEVSLQEYMRTSYQDVQHKALVATRDGEITYAACYGIAKDDFQKEAKEAGRLDCSEFIATCTSEILDANRG